MKILTGEIQAILGIGEARFGLDNRGLVLIQGENHDDPSQDSNGSGKSSLADAICWILFGKTARGLTGDAVVNTNMNGGCFGRLRIDDDGIEYVIERWRKRSINGKRAGVAVYRYDDDGPVDLSKASDKATQLVIDGLIGCSHDVFKAAVYASQEEMPDIPKMTDAALKSLVESAAGIDLIADAYSVARDRLRTAKTELSSSQSNLELVENQLATLDTKRELMLERKSKWEVDQAASIEQATDDLRVKLEAAKKMAAARDAIDVDQVEADILGVKGQIAECDEKIGALKKERERERELEKEASEIRDKLRTAQTKVSVCRKDVERYTKEAERAENRVGDPCGECGKPITHEDVDGVARAARNRASATQLALDEIEAKEGLLVKLHQEFLDRVEEYRATMTDASATNAERIALVKSLSEHQERAQERDRYQSNIDHMKTLMRSQRENIEALKATENPYSQLLTEAESEEANLNKARVEKRKVHDLALETLTTTENVVQLFGPKGVRAYILDTVTPFLNDRTAHYLGALSDGRIDALWSTITETASGEARENFKIEVAKNGAGQSFAALSGGEKRKVRLACALALQDLVASRATKPINLWIGDEIDHALDEAGLERLMNVLEMKAREKGTVLVVSHNSLRDWVRDVCLVEMQDGCATISGALDIEEDLGS